ncbi:MAG: hypothetical protein HGA45_39845 [Chloroflexales bacterium]|nr:hypothetical protein [Chloroflexales bacterium]
MRAGWLRRLHPQVQVVEGWDGATEVGDTPEIRRAYERHIIERLKIGRVTHFFSSEFYARLRKTVLGRAVGELLRDHGGGVSQLLGQSVIRMRAATC